MSKFYYVVMGFHSVDLAVSHDNIAHSTACHNSMMSSKRCKHHASTCLLRSICPRIATIMEIIQKLTVTVATMIKGS